MFGKHLISPNFSRHFHRICHHLFTAFSLAHGSLDKTLRGFQDYGYNGSATLEDAVKRKLHAQGFLPKTPKGLR